MTVIRELSYGFTISVLNSWQKISTGKHVLNIFLNIDKGIFLNLQKNYQNGFPDTFTKYLIHHVLGKNIDEDIVPYLLNFVSRKIFTRNYVHVRLRSKSANLGKLLDLGKIIKEKGHKCTLSYCYTHRRHEFLKQMKIHYNINIVDNMSRPIFLINGQKVGNEKNIDMKEIRKQWFKQAVSKKLMKKLIGSLNVPVDEIVNKFMMDSR